MNIVLITALFAALLAAVLGVALGFFRKIFAVVEDPLKGEIRAILPGANCGACGFPGCDGYAAAVAENAAASNKCSVGGKDVAEKIAALTGGSADVTAVVAVVCCRGVHDKAKLKGEYVGVKSCRAAKIATGSVKGCSWGCQGFGDCALVCKFGALSMGDDGIPVIDYAKCTGCRACAAECPQHIIRIVPKELKSVIPLCSNLNVLKAQVGRNCKNGCIKCQLCVKNCPELCIKMSGSDGSTGVPVIDYARCTNCGTCVEKCPVKVLKSTEALFSA
jgi:RnfABCDGE-type electron transport complex B subunit